MPRARSTLCALAALLAGAAPLASAASTIDASAYVAVAANGELIPDPAARVTYDVVDGSRTLAIPQGMDYVPADRFTMGEGARNHRVQLDAFAIGRFEVTNAEWLEFVDATGRTAPRHWTYGMPPVGTMGLPVTFVSWQDAQDYCAWRSSVTGWTFSLPTEAQWERAARGVRGAAFPWGDQAGASYVDGALTARNNYQGVCAAHLLATTTLLHYTLNPTIAQTPGTLLPLDAARTVNAAAVLGLTADGAVPNWQLTASTVADFVRSDEFAALGARGGAAHTVGSFPSGQSDLGPHDMAGNVAEWTADWYAEAYDRLPGANENPAGPDTSAADLFSNGSTRAPRKVIRGGSWADPLAACRSTARDCAAPETGFATVGFRVVIDYPRATASAGTSASTGPELANGSTAAETAKTADLSLASTLTDASTRATVARRDDRAASASNFLAMLDTAPGLTGLGISALLGGSLLVIFFRRKKP